VYVSADSILEVAVYRTFDRMREQVEQQVLIDASQELIQPIWLASGSLAASE
jgi:hypothetical protein